MNLLSTIRGFVADRSGAVLIEIAIVTPVLGLLAIGGFEVGTMVSRHHDLQSALVDGEAIALAANQGASTDLEGLEEIIRDSVGLTDDQVTLKFLYRCNAAETLVDSKDSCGEDDIVSEYVNFRLQDTYNPIWTDFGISGPVNLEVERTVQLS